MPADGAAWTDLRGVIDMIQKMRILLLGAVSIAGFVMGAGGLGVCSPYGTAGQLAACQHHDVRRRLDDVGIGDGL